jgi:hypothetical protein
MTINDASGAAEASAAAHGVGTPDWIEYHAGPSGGAATRHLQAAAHLDRGFRDRVITELLEERHRVPAPAPGTDTAAVLAECLRARRHSLWTALSCTVLLVVGLIADSASTLAALAVVVAVLLYGVWVRFAEAVVLRLFPSYDSPARRRRLRLVLRLTPWVVYLAVAVIAAADALYQTFAYGDGFGSGSDPLGGNPFSPGIGASDGTSGTPPWVLPLTLLVGWILIGTVSRYLRLQRLAVIADPNSPASAGQPPTWLAPVFERLRGKAPEAETVYGDFQPFVGSGLAVDEWSLQTELRPASVDSEPGELTVTALHEQISAWIQALAVGAEYPGDALHSLKVRDRVLRSGLRVEPHEAWFGALSPDTAADGARALRRAWVRELDRASHPRLRHYVESRAELWNGQLVVSTFLRASVQGHQLYLEGLEYVLPPVAARYRAVDHVLPPDGMDLLRALWTSVTHLGRDLGDNLAQVATTAASVVRGWLRRRWRERMLEAGRTVQQGPRASVRELGAEDDFEVLFQFLDAERVWSAVRERALTAAVALLKQQGYDTAEFEAGARTININNGIQNYGSNVSGAQATGRGARASARPSVPKPRMGAE